MGERRPQQLEFLSMHVKNMIIKKRLPDGTKNPRWYPKQIEVGDRVAVRNWNGFYLSTTPQFDGTVRRTEEEANRIFPEFVGSVVQPPPPEHLHWDHGPPKVRIKFDPITVTRSPTDRPELPYIDGEVPVNHVRLLGLPTTGLDLSKKGFGSKEINTTINSYLSQKRKSRRKRTKKSRRKRTSFPL